MSRIAKAAVITATVGATLAGVAAGSAVADAGAKGVAAGSPGVISGNVIQIPLHVPINLCGNSIDIIALLNAASGNTCVNG
ncbi:chaplin [Streptomyces sp. NPDC002536]|uniref:chaplin n=1 Tax=Streptomyces TaxID=1883 RepID=UPI00300FAC9D